MFWGGALEGEVFAANYSGTQNDCSWRINASGTLTVTPTDGDTCTLTANSSSPYWWWERSSESVRHSVKKFRLGTGVRLGQSLHTLFRAIDRIEEVPGIEDWDTSNVVNMASMFDGTGLLYNGGTLDLSKWDVSNVRTMYYMFVNPGFKELDISGWKTSKLTVTRYWLMYGRTSLTTIYASDDFDVSKVADSEGMFNGDTGLVGGNGTKYIVSSIDASRARVDRPGQPGYFTGKFKIDTVSSHGNITASAERAVANTTINLTTIPENHYKLEQITVKDTQGNDIPVTNNSFNMPFYAVTATAIFKPIDYTIDYDLDGGINASTNPSIYNIETETINLGNPTKPGLYFGGWYKNADFTGEEIANIPQGSHDDIILYAKWTTEPESGLETEETAISNASGEENQNELSVPNTGVSSEDSPTSFVIPVSTTSIVIVLILCSLGLTKKRIIS